MNYRRTMMKLTAKLESGIPHRHTSMMRDEKARLRSTIQPNEPISACVLKVTYGLCAVASKLLTGITGKNGPPILITWPFFSFSLLVYSLPSQMTFSTSFLFQSTIAPSPNTLFRIPSIICLLISVSVNLSLNLSLQ